MSEQTKRLESLYKLGGDITDTSSSILKYELVELSKRLDDFEGWQDIDTELLDMGLMLKGMQEQINELRLMVESQAKAIIKLQEKLK